MEQNVAIKNIEISLIQPTASGRWFFNNYWHFAYT